MKEYLGNPKNTIEIIQKYEFMFQKKFGQNFLIDTHVLEKIINAAGVTKDDCVLEIGPGIGTMTQYLAENARQVVAVEIDRNLIPIWGRLWRPGQRDHHNEDILKVDIRELADRYNGGRPLRWWRIFRTILLRPSSWGCLKAACPLTTSRSWSRRRWPTG